MSPLVADAIWLVQNQFALRSGDWKVESLRAQQTLSFEYLYRWLEAQHARGEHRNLYDPVTKRLLKRYKLPFKKFVVPPESNNVSAPPHHSNPQCLLWFILTR
jgi:hypothetical protein